LINPHRCDNSHMTTSGGSIIQTR